MRSVIVDPGFLVALFDERDPLHLRCREFLRDYRGRFLTTESVFAETLSLLAVDQQLRCLDWLGDSAQVGLLVVDRAALDFRAIERLTRKYSDQPMDFVDAALVLLGMRAGVKEILTADERDFQVYRLGGKARFTDLLRET